MANQVVGDTYVYRFECRVNRTGLLVDPTVVHVSILLGDGSEDTVTYGASIEANKQLIRISEGIYELSYVLPVAGIYRARAGGEWNSGGRTWPSISRREIAFEVDANPHTFTDHAAPTP